VSDVLARAREKLPAGTRVRDVTTLEDQIDARTKLDAITEFVPTEKWLRAAARNKLNPVVWTVVSAGGCESREADTAKAAESLVKRHLEEWEFLCEHFPGTEPKS
jgi:hypothetical protein